VYSFTLVTKDLRLKNLAQSLAHRAGLNVLVIHPIGPNSRARFQNAHSSDWVDIVLKKRQNMLVARIMESQ
jgi:hypothetical protein